jgi:transketolase
MEKGTKSMTPLLSRVHAKNIVEWARERPSVLVLSADLTSSTECDLFRDTYPDRFLSMGIAEQNMHSFAGGLAREGFIPFIHTFGVFIYRRAYDQIAMSIAYPNLPVRMIGFLPGITTPGGATHQAIEDISVLRSLPNMTILECADATDVETILDAMAPISGPVYVRMLRGEIPRLFPPHQPLQINQARIVSYGNDLTIFSSGICTEEAIRACMYLQRHGIKVQHLAVSTLKPFFDPQIAEAINLSQSGVITIENHSIIGGLGTAVAETMAELGITKKLTRLGLQDTFAHGASRSYLMREYGLDALALVTAAGQIVGQMFPHAAAELTRIVIDTFSQGPQAPIPIAPEDL